MIKSVFSLTLNHEPLTPSQLRELENELNSSLKMILKTLMFSQDSKKIHSQKLELIAFADSK